MKALLVHDLYYFRYKFILCICLIISTLLFSSTLGMKIVFYCLIGINFIMMFSPFLLIFDKSNKPNWDFYTLALPIKRNALVHEKYLVALSLTILVALTNIIVLFITRSGWDKNDSLDGETFAEMNILGFFMMGSFMYVLLLTKLVSNDKTIQITIITPGILIVSGIFYILFVGPYELTPIFNIDDPLMLVVPSTITLVLVILVTYVLSLIFAKNRKYG